MHTRITTAIATALMLALAACGGGGGGAAETKCEDLLDVTCDRTAECVTGVTKDQCLDAVHDQIDCGDADSVGATYDSCLDMLHSDDCATLFPGGQLTLPADCNSVIIVN
jgi:hypothetical protein